MKHIPSMRVWNSNILFQNEINNNKGAAKDTNRILQPPDKGLYKMCQTSKISVFKYADLVESAVWF